MYVCMYVCMCTVYVCMYVCMYMLCHVCIYTKNVMKNNSNNKHEIELLFIFISCPLVLPVYAHQGFSTQLLIHINQHDQHHTLMTKKKLLISCHPPPDKITMPLGAP